MKYKSINTENIEGLVLSEHKRYRRLPAGRQGFTLIEIIIVVVIISFLALLVTGNFTTSLKRGRDGKRQSDIQTIRDAYEQYYSVCSFDYPSYTLGAVPSTIVCNSPAQTIMATVPKDPQGNAYEITEGNSGTKTYTICPPVVRTTAGVDYRMETSDCTSVNKTCCISNVQ